MNTTSDHFTAMIGERIQIARKQAKLTQKQLSDSMGFKDRQILANIEGGLRAIKADEFLKLMDILQKSMEWFTDPFLILESKVISWRARRDIGLIDSYESKARNLVAAFRRFHDILGISLNPVLPTLQLSRRNTFEDAWAAAEGLVQQWELGDAPARQLDTILDGLNIHLLYVDAVSDISGAACHLPQLNVVMVNRNESAWRRNFTAVHESFHLMTWDSLPPEVIDREYEDPSKAPRAEQIADNFASALLMPKDSVGRKWKSRGDTELHEWILEMAKEFEVSGTAMYYRLRNLNLITEGMAVEESVDLSRLVRHEPADKPRLYSESFAKTLHQVLDRGLVSVRKVASLLDCTIEDLEELFTEYNMHIPFAL